MQIVFFAVEHAQARGGRLERSSQKTTSIFTYYGAVGRDTPPDSMDDIIEVTGSDGDHEVLTKTEAGGFFGGTLLHERPIAHYLEEVESVAYVVRNKKSGLTIERDDESETITPDGQYQALAVVTDFRVLFVIGHEDGNTIKSVPMDEILDSRVEKEGFRTKAFQIETFSGETWHFPVKSDPAAVADQIEAVAQAWVSTIRLIEEAGQAIANAEGTVQSAPGEAREHLKSATEKMRHARSLLESISEQAVTVMDNQTAGLRERVEPLGRRVAASLAARAHNRSLLAWEGRQYERAARNYDRAISNYSIAGRATGDVPSDEGLERRLQAARRERALLQYWPGIDADSSRRKALSMADPEAAASLWLGVFDRYQVLLTITWPGDEREFVVDRPKIRDRMSGVAEVAIDDTYEAGRSQLLVGDELASAGQDEEASDHYETAQSLFDQASDLARMIDSDHVETVETALFTVERRLRGNVPDEPDEDLVPTLASTANEQSEADVDAVEEAAVEDGEDDGADSDPDDTDGAPSMLEQIKSGSLGSHEGTGGIPTPPKQPGESPPPATGDIPSGEVDRPDSEMAVEVESEAIDEDELYWESGDGEESDQPDQEEPTVDDLGEEETVEPVNETGDEIADEGEDDAVDEPAEEPADTALAGESTDSPEPEAQTDTVRESTTDPVTEPTEEPGMPETTAESADIDTPAAESDGETTTQAEAKRANDAAVVEDSSEDPFEPLDKEPSDDAETNDTVDTETDEPDRDQSERRMDEEDSEAAGDDTGDGEAVGQIDGEGDQPMQDEFESTKITPAIERTEEMDGAADADVEAAIEAQGDGSDESPLSIEDSDARPAATDLEELIPEVSEEEQPSGGETESNGRSTEAKQSLEEIDSNRTDLDWVEEEDNWLVSRILHLPEDRFTRIVADLWDRRGWSTTIFSATGTSVYDVIAIRETDQDTRLLLWTHHRPEGDAVDSTIVRRCATTRDSSTGRNEAVLVTTGDLTPTARRRAEELDVTVVELEQLAEYVKDAEFEDELLQQATP